MRIINFDFNLSRNFCDNYRIACTRVSPTDRDKFATLPFVENRIWCCFVGRITLVTQRAAVRNSSADDRARFLRWKRERSDVRVAVRSSGGEGGVLWRVYRPTLLPNRYWRTTWGDIIIHVRFESFHALVGFRRHVMAAAPRFERPESVYVPINIIRPPTRSNLYDGDGDVVKYNLRALFDPHNTSFAKRLWQ